MESIERPQVALNARAVDLRAAAGRLAMRRLASLRLLLGAAVVAISIGLGAIAVLAPPPAFRVSDTPDGPVVTSVGVGSYGWQSGVRLGAVGSWEEGENAPRDIVRFELGSFVTGVPLANLPAETQDSLLALACATLAVVLMLARLPGSPALLALASGIALYEFEWQVGLPAAVPLFAFPPLAALLAIRLGARRRQVLFDLAALLAIGALVVFGLVLAQGTTDVSWAEVWRLPLLLGLFIALAGGLVGFAVRYRSLPAATPGRLIAAAVPLATHSRLAGAEEERSRLAVELHNSVLPRVQTSLDALRQDGSVEAASQLEGVAADLRGAMARRQTVTLEIGGVAAALRSEFDDLPGPRVEFFVRGGSNRPPRRVELAAYRVGQAAIDNALRHSGAERVSVEVTSAADAFELSVTDDGVGLDSAAEQEALRRGHIGLAQMRLRAETVGAALEVSGAPDSGTAVRFRWAG